MVNYLPCCALYHVGAWSVMNRIQLAPDWGTTRCVQSTHLLTFCRIVQNDIHDGHVCDQSQVMRQAKDVCVYCVNVVCVCVNGGEGLACYDPGSLSSSIMTAPAIWGHNCQGSLWLVQWEINALCLSVHVNVGMLLLLLITHFTWCHC